MDANKKNKENMDNIMNETEFMNEDLNVDLAIFNFETSSNAKSLLDTAQLIAESNKLAGSLMTDKALQPSIAASLKAKNYHKLKLMVQQNVKSEQINHIKETIKHFSEVDLKRAKASRSSVLSHTVNIDSPSKLLNFLSATISIIVLNAQTGNPTNFKPTKTVSTESIKSLIEKMSEQERKELCDLIGIK